MQEVEHWWSGLDAAQLKTHLQRPSSVRFQAGRVWAAAGFREAGPPGRRSMRSAAVTVSVVSRFSPGRPRAVKKTTG